MHSMTLVLSNFVSWRGTFAFLAWSLLSLFFSSWFVAFSCLPHVRLDVLSRLLAGFVILNCIVYFVGRLNIERLNIEFHHSFWCCHVMLDHCYHSSSLLGLLPFHACHMLGWMSYLDYWLDSSVYSVFCRQTEHWISSPFLMLSCSWHPVVHRCITVLSRYRRMTVWTCLWNSTSPTCLWCTCYDLFL